MLTIESKRRILSIVLESIKMEDPEYIDKIAPNITGVVCNLIDHHRKFPEKNEFLKKCSRISTKFFKFNKVNRTEFFENLYERLRFSKIEFFTPIDAIPVEWNYLLKEIGLTQDMQRKMLWELENLRREYVESINDIMKTLIQLKTKVVVSGSELEVLRQKFESFVLILELSERNQKSFINRLKGWGSEIGLGVIGNFLFDLLKQLG